MVDAPDFAHFNGDPEKLKTRIINPERIAITAPADTAEKVLEKVKTSAKSK